MKILSTLLLTVVTSVFVTSCSDSNTETLSHEHEQHITQQPSSEASSDIANMMLNNGQKWQMDKHTHSTLAEMKANITSVDISSSTTEELLALGDELTLQLESLIQGCTMVGAEHDQLHIFLTGFIPALSELTETGCIETAEKVLHYLNNYSNYFE